MSPPQTKYEKVRLEFNISLVRQKQYKLIQIKILSAWAHSAKQETASCHNTFSCGHDWSIHQKKNPQEGVARNNSGTLLRYSLIWLCHSRPKLEYISLFWEAVQSVSMLIDYEVIIIRLNSPFRAKFDDKTSTKLRSGLFDQLGHVLDLRDRKRIFEILCRI